MKKTILLAISICFLLYSPFVALATNFKVDQSHSNVGFTVKHLVVSKVRGNFHDYKGTEVFDKAKKKLISVEAIVKTKSINTRHKKRDGHLRSPDFFNVRKYPTLKFKSTKVTQKGSDITVVGNFTMHGVTKPLTLKGSFNGMIKGHKGAMHLGFEAKGKISRKDYGIKWNKIMETGGLAVGDEVTIILEVEAIEKM